MKQRIARFYKNLAGLLILSCCCFADEVYVPTPLLGLQFKDLVELKGGVDSYKGSQKVQLAKDLFFSISVTVTSKGNGLLEIFRDDRKCLSVRIVDMHDNGDLIKDKMLHYVFVDVDGDNVLDLVITGVRQITHETGGHIIREEAVHDVYKFDNKKQLFIKEPPKEK